MINMSHTVSFATLRVYDTLVSVKLAALTFVLIVLVVRLWSDVRGCVVHDAASVPPAALNAYFPTPQAVQAVDAAAEKLPVRHCQFAVGNCQYLPQFVQNNVPKQPMHHHRQ
jgi:hypothetical protein